MARILLKFAQSQVHEPVTSRVVLESGVPINILNANVTTKGGEMLAEVEGKHIDQIAALFRKHGVIVDVQKRIEVDRDRCIDCGACYSLCPVDVITFEEDRTVVFDVDKCIACGLCVDTCPMKAIHV